MKALFLAIVFVHALIHMLGFVKAFELGEIKALMLPISKPFGLIWLLGCILLLTYGALVVVNGKYAWIVGLLAVVVSQFLVISFWGDAKFGTIPNVIILIASIFSMGNYAFASLTERETSEIVSASPAQTTEIFTEAEAETLPMPVKRWLESSGAFGKEKTRNGIISQKARMRLKPTQEKWHDATAIQYTVIDRPAFIWTVHMKMNPLVWIKGRDKFTNGKGEMLIRLNALVNVVNEDGEKIDEGSLQRFLGEMVWFPSLAVSPYVSWEAIDQHTARATMTFEGTRGSGTFHFNEAGDFVKFSAFRFQGNSPDSERKEWILTVDDYCSFEGIRVPSKMKATWMLENSAWNWLNLEIEDIEYNTTPHHL